MVNAMIVFIFCLFFGVPQQLFAGAIAVTPQESSIVFRINHDLGYTVGYFKDFTAAVELGDDQVQIVSAKAQVQMSSINTRNAIRDEGLKSAMFLNAGQFPQAVFESIKVEGDEISGVLTIKGISKPVTFKIQKDADGKKILLKGSFNRNDFGISYNKVLANKKKSIGDVVELIIEIKV